MLSSDVITEFRERESIIHVLPLTVSEYAEGKNLAMADAWDEYIVTGGIPLVASMNSADARRDYLINLNYETYLKNIAARHRVKNPESLSELYNMAASITGSPISALKISDTFASSKKEKHSSATVDKYLGYFADAFTMSKVRKWNVKGGKYVGAPYKIYFEDIGIRNAALNFQRIEETHIMENVIYNELRYRGFQVDTGEVEYRVNTDRKDKNGHEIYAVKKLEVDFAARRDPEKYYIQSALDMRGDNKASKEKRPFMYIHDSFPKIIVTRNGLSPTVDENGILTMDLFDFLQGNWIR